MFGSNNKHSKVHLFAMLLLSLSFSFSQLVSPSQMRLEMPPDYKEKNHIHFSKLISSELDSIYRICPLNSSSGSIDSNHVSSSEADCGGLAQEKTSDPLLDSTLFCSTEELQGVCVCVCGWLGGSIAALGLTA